MTEEKGDEQEVQAQPTVEELQGQLNTVTTERDAAKEEALAHQQNVSKKAGELAKREAQESKISGLEENVKVLTDMVADLVDRGDDEVETPKRRKSEEYLKQLKPNDTANVELSRKATEADKLARSVGLEVDKSPELRQAYILFRVGDADAGLEEIQRIVDSKKAEAAKPKEVKFADLSSDDQERIKREDWDGKGLTRQDKQSPTGGTSDTDFIERMTSGALPLTKENNERFNKIQGIT